MLQGLGALVLIAGGLAGGIIIGRKTRFMAKVPGFKATGKIRRIQSKDATDEVAAARQEKKSRELYPEASDVGA